MLAPNGFKDATTDETTVRKWWGRHPDANIATPTNWCVVLDIDPRNGGDHSLAELERRYGALPDTAEVLTGGGGRHIYFARGPVALGCSTGKVAEGIDVKAEGGYVLLSPSSHVSGGTYHDEILHPLFDTPLKPMPRWLEERASAAPTNGHHAGPVKVADVVPAGQRNTALYQLGRSLHARGLSEAEILATLRATNQTRCNPPLADDEVQHVARESATQADRPDFRAASATVEAPAAGWPVFDAAEAWTFAPPTFTVDELIPEFGVMWVGGPPKRFKSLFMQYIAFAVASGREFVAEHFRILRRPRILYVAREDGGSRLQSRRDDIIAAWPCRPEAGALHFLIRPRFDLLCCRT